MIDCSIKHWQQQDMTTQSAASMFRSSMDVKDGRRKGMMLMKKNG